MFSAAEPNLQSRLTFRVGYTAKPRCWAVGTGTGGGGGPEEESSAVDERTTYYSMQFGPAAPAPAALLKKTGLPSPRNNTKQSFGDSFLHVKNVLKIFFEIFFENDSIIGTNVFLFDQKSPR